ncbi:MAG TPA: MFS transporter [Candidatus Sulfotelmatobacter sp.]|nr:MFS transporter [Candidatus Sulfotelmatobacter sp.]
MPFLAHFRRLTAAQRNTFIACFLGWSLDAFDFFILVFCVNALATQFQVKVSAITQAIFWTLAMRPVGAFLFGMIADRFGRRPTLMINIIAYSIFELASAFAPTLHVFLVTRALFGIAMGGEWGVGAALAFETLPAEGRGFFSGLLQEGYVAGQLLAALVYGLLFRFVGWRGMFVVGALPALLAFFIFTHVEESPAWRQGKTSRDAESRIGTNIFEHLGLFIFLVVLMFGLNSLSHGTQDLYPTFLEKNLHFAPAQSSMLGIIYSVGAFLGGITFGNWSEKIGRRRAIVTAALLTIPVIPLWSLSHSFAVLAIGSFVMQFLVQGAWGVIPAHLNELSPPAMRGTFPGFTYQCGNLLSSWNSVLQSKVAERRFSGNLAPVLAWTVLIIASLVALVTWSGHERRGADLSNTN